ncbi:hypothetical protein [Parvicella tangerina]|uniref:Uncharacterized protein n=1 Tax=Parvicella tangerina TaxID=2829795 RepID=A0A916JLB3_9FLAO|nr:hypothetical protein [Parvicella tangerina]CAG5079909.1 hypothetical protein CRYO30217_01116 [Parvicella tangerina]
MKYIKEYRLFEKMGISKDRLKNLMKMTSKLSEDEMIDVIGFVCDDLDKKLQEKGLTEEERWIYIWGEDFEGNDIKDDELYQFRKNMNDKYNIDPKSE